MRNNINSLEAYRDLAYGTIVFNITGLPRSECEAFRSVTKINNGELSKSKLEDFSILKYSQGEDSVAITLNKNTRICGKKMFETKIKNIFVVLLENQEEYLENKKLQIAWAGTGNVPAHRLFSPRFMVSGLEFLSTY